MPNRNKLLNANDARVARARRQLTKPLQRWIAKVRDEFVREAIAELKDGRIKLRKADDRIRDEELLRILAAFGLRQIDRSGKQVADALGAEWVIPPTLISDVIAEKAIKIKSIRKDVLLNYKEIVRTVMDWAEHTHPIPSIAQISKVIRSSFDDEYAVSYERAAVIARTESLQNEATGIDAGMEIAGVEEIEWLSSRNPNHGDRRHDLMNGKKVKRGEKFTTPFGNKLRFPGDPQAPIEDTVNCGCTFAPVRIRRAA